MPASTTSSDGAFSHLAMLYAGMEGFLEGTVSFLRHGLAADEPMRVARRRAIGVDGPGEARHAFHPA